MAARSIDLRAVDPEDDTIVAGDDSPLSAIAAARANGRADPLDDSDWVLANEKALTAAIMAQRSAIIWQPFAIPRIQVETDDGPRPLTFRVRGLSQDEWERLDRRAQMPTGRRTGSGMMKETKRNDALYNLLLVTFATHPDDHKRLWGSARLRETLGVAGEEDVVRLTLQPGEIARVGVEIAALSGYLPTDDELGKSPS